VAQLQGEIPPVLDIQVVENRVVLTGNKEGLDFLINLIGSATKPYADALFRTDGTGQFVCVVPQGEVVQSVTTTDERVSTAIAEAIEFYESQFGSDLLTEFKIAADAAQQ
jgi:hypothetical protein